MRPKRSAYEGNSWGYKVCSRVRGWNWRDSYAYCLWDWQRLFQGWNEAGYGEIEFSSWKDGEYIINGSSLQGYVLGSISINNSAPSTINVPGNTDTTIFSDTMLFLQERLEKDGEELKIVSERSYLNGKKFIINADLVMDGNGGLTPYPGDTDEAERVVIYTDSDL